MASQAGTLSGHEHSRSRLDLPLHVDPSVSAKPPGYQRSRSRLHHAGSPHQRGVVRSSYPEGFSRERVLRCSGTARDVDSAGMVRAEFSREVREQVKEHGGAWIAGDARALGSVLRLACSAEHVWEMTVVRLLAGKWCPQCARYRHTILDMQKLARKWRGQCLWNVYRGTLVHLKWRCASGHEWMATPNTILSGCWCPACRLGKGSIEQCKAIARKRGGECLSTHYENKDTRLLWRCEQGHEWRATAGHVKLGSWCPYCAGNLATLEDMHALARRFGGRCLSKRYVNAKTPLRWQCAKGHTFRKRPDYVKQNSFCPQCSLRQPGSIERMQHAARQRGGQCLSKQFVNTATKLRWVCAKGHVWLATPAHVLAGSWCPRCASSAQWTLPQMRALARDRGGVCLSNRYVKSRVRLRWRCSQGHEFEATPAAVMAGRWCLPCKRAQRANA